MTKSAAKETEYFFDMFSNPLHPSTSDLPLQRTHRVASSRIYSRLCLAPSIIVEPEGAADASFVATDWYNDHDTDNEKNGGDDKVMNRRETHTRPRAMASQGQGLE